MRGITVPELPCLEQVLLHGAELFHLGVPFLKTFWSFCPVKQKGLERCMQNEKDKKCSSLLLLFQLKPTGNMSGGKAKPFLYKVVIAVQCCF